MVFYEQGRQEGDFEEGVRMSLQALLASPKFLFRLEEVPGHGASGAELPHHRVRPGLAPVVLPVGQRTGRGAAEAGGPRTAAAAAA